MTPCSLNSENLKRGKLFASNKKKLGFDKPGKCYNVVLKAAL